MSWQWGLQNTAQTSTAPDATRTSTTPTWTLTEAWGQDDHGAGQTVAVVDTGIDRTHPDLAGQVVGEHNFVDRRQPNATDGNGHGTHVSGTIAASATTASAIAGVAPDASSMALRALDDDGGGSTPTSPRRSATPATHGVRVVNASLGGAGASQALERRDQRASEHAVRRGRRQRTARDNDDAADVYPCELADRRTSSASARPTNRDEPADVLELRRRDSVDLFAPGVRILSTIPIAPSSLEHQHYRSSTARRRPPRTSPASPRSMLQVNPHLTRPAAQARSSLDTVDEQARVRRRLGVRRPAQRGRRPSRTCSPAAIPLDTDGDGVVDAADACPTVAAPGQSDGCPLDARQRRQAGPVDNCDLDRPTRRRRDARPRRDRRRLRLPDDARGPRHRPTTACGSVDDRCPTVLRQGRPPTAARPPTTGRHRPRSRRRGRHGDGCPNEPAATINGCPLPAVTSLSAKARKRRATVKVATSRAATVEITVERKRGKRWVRVARKTLATSPNRARG